MPLPRPMPFRSPPRSMPSHPRSHPPPPRQAYPHAQQSHPVNTVLIKKQSTHSMRHSNHAVPIIGMGPTTSFAHDLQNLSAVSASMGHSRRPQIGIPGASHSQSPFLSANGVNDYTRGMAQSSYGGAKPSGYVDGYSDVHDLYAQSRVSNATKAYSATNALVGSIVTILSHFKDGIVGPKMLGVSLLNCIRCILLIYLSDMSVHAHRPASS